MSSQTQGEMIVQVFVQKVKNEVAAMHGELETLSGYNEKYTLQVLNTYYDSLDKEGFMFDFDMVWQWAGYSRKDKAKRVIAGEYDPITGAVKRQPLLRGNIDYHVTRPNSLPPNGGVKFKGQHGGDRKTEKIMLSARGFSQFALSARTPAGQILRDVVFSAMRILKQLQEAIQNGTHRIVLVRPDAQTDTRDTKRLKVCETQKALMREMVDANPDFSRLCGQINGETNKAATGRYKYELARELGKPAKKVNARDYMTPPQLAAAELIEILSRDKIKTSEDPLEAHKDICRRLAANFNDELHGTIADEPRGLREVRKTAKMKQVENQSHRQQQHANTINNYFISNPTSN